MKLLASTFAILVLMMNPAHAEEPVLVDIFPNDQIKLQKSLPELFKGDLSYAEIDEALKLLMLTGNYERVLAREGESNRIEILGRGLRVIRELSFRGNSAISYGELKEVSELRIGEKFDRKRILSAGEQLKKLYAERGYFNAIIEVSFIRLKDNNLNISFNIREKLPCRINELTFVSSNSELNERLAQHVAWFKNDPLTAESTAQLSEKVREYLLKRRFLKAKFEEPIVTYNEDKTRASLQFVLSEPYRYEFYWEDLTGKARSNPSELYSAAALDSYERPSEDPPGEVSERIRRYYLSKGYPNVQVEHREVELANDYVRRVYVKVIEGPRVKISEFDIQGRLSRPPKYYVDFIKRNSSPLIQKGYYNRDDLELGYKNLVTDLRNQGYLRAKVQSARIEYQKDKTEAKILVLLDEGPLTQIRAIRFEGLTAFSEKQLAEILTLQPQAPLRLSELEDNLNRLRSFYLENGYLEMKLLNEAENLIEYNDKGTQATLNFKLFEGPQVIVAGIAIEGNTFTKDRVIRREIDIEEGDILTPEKIEESMVRLNKMGIFSRVSIRTLEEGTTVARRNVIISVTERDPGTLRFGFGANNERQFTLTGTTGVSYSNLFGTARAVSARVRLNSNVAQTKYLEHEATLGYLEPFLFGSRVRGRANYTRSNLVKEYDEAAELTKVLLSDRFDLLLERDLTRHIKLTWKTWSLDSRKEFDRNGYCRDRTSPSQTEKCPASVQQVAKIGPILDLDYRDNPFLPTKGSYSRLAVDLAKPNFGSSDQINFVRSEALVTHYWRVLGSQRWIWANSLRGGYVKNIGDNVTDGVPATDAFILGGLGSIRGFDGTREGDRIPTREEMPIEDSNSLIIRTHSSYYLLKTELRFPLYQDWVSGAVFYDGGAVQVPDYDIPANRSETKFSQRWRDAAGVALKINTPVGPVGFDFAWKIKPLPQEAGFKLYFSIGTF